MSGGPDPIYVRARTALLDAADALAEQLDAVVLVGAQAIYLHAGDADFAVAEYTTDADFCVAPADLGDRPLLSESLEAHGFSLREHPGAWMSPDGIPVDLMVPAALAGAGSRGARLGPHGKRAARRAKGLEGALVHRERIRIASLQPGDARTVVMLVAGPAALLVATLTRTWLCSPRPPPRLLRKPLQAAPQANRPPEILKSYSFPSPSANASNSCSTPAWSASPEWM
jgi:hypothetical protein